ncbi:hypothetical protein AUC47_01995 [Microbacterium sp. SZ1]|uniref:hypothetical protein n=1 Tax=Microbacterium sp. SZ1 TaxID=1849736 RepID=UPI000BBC2478|nr:hypothetical protein [Microbacterium sp. SZ1]PCE14936.1 hypothetical protein AUC47_01995 [Microbacterium sp. SZ1]
MAENTQPDLQWGPLEQKPRGRGRIWIIVGLAVAALIVVGVLLFFLLPRADGQSPEASATPSPSATTTEEPTPAPTIAPDPTMTPVTTPPPVPDPSVDAFREQVRGWLDDALTGIDIVSASSGQEALSVVETLEDDAQRLSETPAPTSIQSGWSEALGRYAESLAALRTAVSDGSGTSASAESARASAEELRTVVGL